MKKIPLGESGWDGVSPIPIVLNPETFDRLMELLADKPPPPSEALKESFAKRRK